MFDASAVRTRLGASASVLAALLLLIALACVALHVVHIVAKFRAAPADAFGDFNLYLYAFDAVLHDPARLYDQQSLIDFQRRMGARAVGDDLFYAYPPPFALLFSPLARLAPLTAKFVWLAGSLASYAAALALLVKLAYRGAERSMRVVLVAIALLSFPLIEDTYDGQSNEMLLLLLVATFVLIERGKCNAAGAVLGIAIALKLTPFALAGLLLLRREWRTFVVANGVAIAINVMTGVGFGFRVLLHYYIFDMPRLSDIAQAIDGGLAPANNSIKGALWTLASHLAHAAHAGSGSAAPPWSADTLSTLAFAVVVGICVLSAYLMLRRHEDSRVDYALAVSTMLVAYPVLEPIHMVLATLPLILLFGTSFEEPACQLSAFAPKLEWLLASLAVLLLFFSARFVSYTVALLLIHALCVARYFPPTKAGRRYHVERPV